MDGDYLAILAIKAAVEIKNYISGKDDYFSNVEEFSAVIKKYQKSCHPGTSDEFPYLPLKEAMEIDSDGKIYDNHELSLEMNLLYLELKNVGRLPEERLQNLRNFLVQASVQYCLNVGRGCFL